MMGTSIIQESSDEPERGSISSAFARVVEVLLLLHQIIALLEDERQAMAAGKTVH